MPGASGDRVESLSSETQALGSRRVGGAATDPESARCPCTALGLCPAGGPAAAWPGARPLGPRDSEPTGPHLKTGASNRRPGDSQACLSWAALQRHLLFHKREEYIQTRPKPAGPAPLGSALPRPSQAPVAAQVAAQVAVSPSPRGPQRTRTRGLPDSGSPGKPLGLQKRSRFSPGRPPSPRPPVLLSFKRRRAAPKPGKLTVVTACFLLVSLRRTQAVLPLWGPGAAGVSCPRRRADGAIL